MELFLTDITTFTGMISLLAIGKGILKFFLWYLMFTVVCAACYAAASS